VEPLRYPRPAVLDRVPRDGHVVIEASAGTGKTHTLEHLVVDLVLEERAEINEILIVTFTEPATAELKARVRGKFEDMVRIRDHACGPDEPHWLIDPDTRAKLQGQLDKFGRSSIHTIHGFCHRVLQENAFHLRRLFDEEHSESASIFDMAFKRALREEIATDPDLQNYLLAWLEQRSLGDLGRSLASLTSEDARLEPSFSERGLRKAVGNLSTMSSSDLATLRQAFHGRLVRSIPSDFIADKLNRLVDDLLGAVTAFADDRNLAAVLAATDEQLEYLLEGSRYTDNMFQELHGVEVPGGSAEVSLKAALVRLIPLRTAALHKLLPSVREKLTEVKAEGWFDYDDMLTGVWEVMEDPEDSDGKALVDYLRDRYKVALIDEFQDTDPVQWNIFRRVFFESNDAANRLFVIGDPKQAIYGFRGADVHTYLEAKEAILSDRGDEEPVRLRQNFRSTPALVAAYNCVFDQTVEEPFFDGPIRYDAPVECGRPHTRVIDAAGESMTPVRYVRLVPRSDRLDAYALKRTHGKWIAQEVRRLLDEGVRMVDDETGEERTVGPKDIYILTRSGAEARRIGSYLREVEVPFAFYKEEGLFQTAEARHALELLVAIADPYSRSNRLKAWSTPFFDVPFEQLSNCRNLPETHPLMAMLLDWHDLADRGEFERLFADVLDRSGVVRREIFAGPSERELTNYMHIFEILLEEVHRERAALSDLIVRLRAYIDQSGYPQSDDRNIQRLETDKASVQVMTIHKSKGLQADVVFIYGGMSAAPQTDKFRVCHQGDERVVYMGLPQSSAAMQTVARETRWEDQRLLYVAITRARGLVYLPYVASVDGELQYGYLNGTYKVVNDRLLQIAARDFDRVEDVGPAGDERPMRLFEMEVAYAEKFAVEEGVLHMPPAATYADWELPREVGDPAVDAEIEKLRGRPLIVSSYSRMKRTSEYIDGEGSREAFMLEVSARAEAFRTPDELPGGTDTGIFLHDILERVDFRDVIGEDLESWSAKPEVDTLFRESIRTHGIDPKFDDFCRRMVWDTLTTPLDLPGCRPVDGLFGVDRDLREVEFLFPIPESDNPRVDRTPPPDVVFDVKRGYLKGYIDLMFEYDGRVFFADWKSDSLDHYAEAELAEHIMSHYQTQAWLYSLATLKMFGIHSEEDFDARFGGFMYAFLRGIDGTPDRGFYVHRPTFDEIRAYERELEGTRFR
jgi:exodeoxyribonuclease V beta subunit